MHTSYCLACESVVFTCFFFFLRSKFCPALMYHLMYNDSSSPNIHFQALLVFLASLIHEKYYPFLEEGRHNKYHSENSTGIYDYQKPKE